jgi:hypothetical protein
MELKSGDNDYYAIYKEYKQKYLDLKNNILGGGKGNDASKVLDIKKIFESISFIQGSDNKKKIKDYNTIINRSILNQSTIKELQLDTTSKKYEIVKETIKEKKIFEFFEQIKKIENHNIELQRLQKLQKQRDSITQKEAIINNLKGVHNSIVKIKSIHFDEQKNILDDNNYNSMIYYLSYGNNEKINTFINNNNTMNDMIALIKNILNPSTTTTQSAATPAASTTKVSSSKERQRLSSGEQGRQTQNVPPPPPPPPTTKTTKTDVSQPQPQTQKLINEDISQKSQKALQAAEIAKSQPVKECTDKKIKKFKIDNNISQCKFTDKEKLNDIYIKQINFLNSIKNQVKDQECKVNVAEKIAKLNYERDKCEDKIPDNKQVLDDFDASDQYNQITQTTENEASDKKVKQTELVADKFMNVQKKTDSVNKKLRNAVSKARDNIVQKNAYEADLRNAQASFSDSDSDLYYTELNQQQQQTKPAPIATATATATAATAAATAAKLALKARAQTAQKAQQQEQQEQQKQEEYDDYTRKRLNIDNDTDSDNNFQTDSLSGVTTPSSTQYFDQKNYLIKVGDKFLIFDINESQMAKIKDIQTNCNKIINSPDLKEFYDNFSTFHQLKEDDEIKHGKLIINKNRFKDLLTEKKIINAYIITILSISSDNKSFKIDVYDLSNKSNIAEFNQNIDNIETRIKNIKECDIKDADFDKISIDKKDSDNMARSVEQLNKVIEDYKQMIMDKQHEDNLKLNKLKQELINKLTIIKTSNNITQQHIINEELNINKRYNGSIFFTVGNPQLLQLIKNKINSNVLDGSMILKLQNAQINKDEINHNSYKFGEYINKYTPYSTYNNAYLLLGLVISHQRYIFFTKKLINNSLPESPAPASRTRSLSQTRNVPSEPQKRNASLNIGRK